MENKNNNIDSKISSYKDKINNLNKELLVDLLKKLLKSKEDIVTDKNKLKLNIKGKN